MTEFLAAVRWLFGIESPAARHCEPDPRSRRGEWRTSATGGWEWIEDPRRDAAPSSLVK